MALGNILQMIARPQTANIGQAVNQGILSGQQMRQNNIKTNMLEQAATQGEQKILEEKDRNNLTKLSLTINDALALGPGESQDKLLNQALGFANPGTAPQLVINDIINTQGEAKQQKLKQTVARAEQQGLIKGPAKAVKTAEQIEREIAATEIKADATTKTPAIKEFEFAEKNPKFALKQKEENMVKSLRESAGKEFKNAMDLRKEFTAQSSEFQKVRDAYTRVKGSTKDPSAAGDLSLIFNYMKMLDPGSVVRESEFATAAAAGGYGERIKAAVQKIGTGERLSTKMRSDFLSKSAVLMDGMLDQHKKREKSYKAIAERNKLSPDEVVVDLSIPEPQSTETPGQVYRDGTIIENDAGERMIMKNNKWIPTGGL